MSLVSDLHRNYYNRFKYYDWQKDPDHALIVLGDLGFNYLLDERDKDWKRGFCNKYDFQLYAVRGNHEERPQNITGMQLVYDENVNGEVYWEPEYPNIHYFKDFGEYEINGYKVLILGGAYSVDKYYRIAMHPNSSWTGWFAEEQLNDTERAAAAELCKGKSYDFVLSHTCPISWEPRDLFLSVVDQSTVDKTMELWLEDIKSSFSWNIWLFGHYHADRFERPHVEQYFEKTDKLENIYNRWKEYDITGNLPWYIEKSLLFYNKESYFEEFKNVSI